MIVIIQLIIYLEKQKSLYCLKFYGKEYILVIGSNDPRKTYQLIETYLKENIREDLVIVGNKYLTW